MDKNSGSKYGLTSTRFRGNKMCDRAYEVSEKAKKKHRTDLKLKEWSRYKYYKSDFCDKMLKNTLKGMFDIAYEDGNTLSVEKFREIYELQCIPLVIKNANEKWKARKNWNFEVILCLIQDLYQDFKDTKVKVGEDDEGYKIKVKFKYFMEYLIYNTDDSPLYLFESSIENHKDLKSLMKDYEVPKYFKEDLFEMVK